MASNKTRVLIKFPQSQPLLSLCDLLPGTYFSIDESNDVFIKSSDAVGKQRRCCNIKTGEIVMLMYNTAIRKVFPNVRIDLEGE